MVVYKKKKVDVATPTTAIVPVGRTKRRRRRRYKMSAMAPTKPAKLPKYALALSNPFAIDAEGVKIPDSATTPSIGFKDINIATLQCDATAANIPAFAFLPNISAYYVAATAASGSWTWAATYGGGTASAAKSNIETNFTGLRPVAHGIRVVANQSVTNAQGFIHLCLYANTNYNVTTWAYPTTIAQMSRLPGYRRISVSSLTQQPIVYVNKYLDETSYRYFDPKDDQLTHGSSGSIFEFSMQWNTIILALEGTTPASSAVNIVEVENLVHFEGIPRIGSTLAIPVTPAEPANVFVTNGTSRMLAKKDPLIVDEGKPSEESFVEKMDLSNFCDAECRGDVTTGLVAGALHGFNTGGIYGGAVGAASGAYRGYSAYWAKRVGDLIPGARYSPYQSSGGGRRARAAGVMLGNNNNQIV